MIEKLMMMMDAKAELYVRTPYVCVNYYSIHIILYK